MGQKEPLGRILKLEIPGRQAMSWMNIVETDTRLVGASVIDA